MTRLISLATQFAALLALVAAFVVAPAAFAQVAPADRHAQRVERLAEMLDLTDAQRVAVTDAMGDHTPGALWDVAAALAPTLTDAQKERLFTQPERADRPRRDRADRPRGDRKQRGERMKRERPNADSLAQRRDAHRVAMQSAMRSALNLSDAQVQQLDAVHEARKDEREARVANSPADRQQRMQNRPAPGEVPAEIAAILTPEQEEVFKVHHAFAMHVGHGMMRHGAMRHHRSTDR